MTFRFDSFADFLFMGSYWPYVWSCFGMTLLVFVALAWLVRWRKKRFFKEERRALMRTGQLK